MAKKATHKGLLTLAALVGFGENGTFASAEQVKSLVDAGYAETNPAVAAPIAGEIAVRATEAGKAHVVTEAGSAEAAAAVTKTQKTEFEIEEGVEPVGKRPRGRSGATKYPFDKLEIGQSFFVPGDDAVKSMASTVSSATKRHSEETKDEAGNVVTYVNRKGNVAPKMTPLRKFHVEVATKDGVKGARIFRDAL